MKHENFIFDQKKLQKLSNLFHQKALCGTEYAMAPEVFSSTNYGPEVDWWGLGIVLFGLYTGENPFTGTKLELLGRIRRKELVIPDNVPAEAASLIRQLLEKNPQYRLGSAEKGLQEIKSDPFFHGIEWGTLNLQEVSPEHLAAVRELLAESKQHVDVPGGLDLSFQRELVTSDASVSSFHWSKVMASSEALPNGTG